MGTQSGANRTEVGRNGLSAQAGLKVACAVCKSQMPDPKTYKQHFENKHPKNPMPAELKDV